MNVRERALGGRGGPNRERSLPSRMIDLTFSGIETE
jgi:hypothetical protein